MTPDMERPATAGDGPSERDQLSRRDRAEHSPKRPRVQRLGRYPYSPGFKDEGTRREAALAYAPKAATRRDQVLAGLGAGPATAEEIGERIGLHWYLTRPRLSELKELGLVIKTGERGRGALGGGVNQWRLTTEQERIDFAATVNGGNE